VNTQDLTLNVDAGCNGGSTNPDVTFLVIKDFGISDGSMGDGMRRMSILGPG
jgi:hypothetical protein